MSNAQLLINQLQDVSTWGLNRPVVDWLIVVHCSSVNFAKIVIYYYTGDYINIVQIIGFWDAQVVYILWRCI